VEEKEKLTDTGLLVFQGFGSSYWTVSFGHWMVWGETLPINFLIQIYF
jgi:hypothetical protein